jgi:hypothetical protein
MLLDGAADDDHTCFFTNGCAPHHQREEVAVCSKCDNVISKFMHGAMRFISYVSQLMGHDTYYHVVPPYPIRRYEVNQQATVCF